ncbi:MAG: RluA family pseudouridine synthase [Clostridia bacterium]|nr:RluA family pseudouridine synthase [Clostridia bacterium]
MRIISHIAKETDAGRSVAAILRGELRLSNGLIARLKREGCIFLNGASAKTNMRVCAGDVVSAAVGERPDESSCAPLPFPILLEDEDILIIDKPAGAAVYGSRYDEDAVSVEEAVNAYFGKAGLFHPVNRLDRGTTGAMAIAKSGFMHEKLAGKLHTGNFERTYFGICEGVFDKKSGRIDLPIARVFSSAIKREVREDGSPAATQYRVLDEKNGVSAVEFRLETGRTHQIRVHTAHLKHPLVGDFLYGTEDKSLIARPALHSWRLCFIHPLSGKRIGLEAPIPRDMLALLNAPEKE